jgi:preprotein translocase subunit SecG
MMMSKKLKRVGWSLLAVALICEVVVVLQMQGAFKVLASGGSTADLSGHTGVSFIVGRLIGLPAFVLGVVLLLTGWLRARREKTPAIS